MPRSRFLPTLLALLLAPCAFAAAAAVAMHGLPSMQRFDAGTLPASIADYGGEIAVDAHGVLYVGTGEGVMTYRNGTWRLVELPHHAGAASLLSASDGRLYVSGTAVLGELVTDADGSLRFVDLLPKFAHGGDALATDDVNDIAETPHGVYFLGNAALFLLGHDGKTRRWRLPAQTQHTIFAVDDAVYVRVEGVGLCRIEDGAPLPVPGADTFANLSFFDLWAYRDGLLIASSDGFRYADAGGIRKLASDAATDAAFAAHRPYASRRLPDGSFVLGGDDGMVLHLSPELHLQDSFASGLGSLRDFETDAEGGLWASGENGLMRLRLPSSWTVYDQRHGLDNMIFDSAWHEGALWVATSTDVQRAEAGAAGAAPHFAAQGWARDNHEAFALESTEAGLLIAHRSGVMVLEPGAERPRSLFRQNGAHQGIGLLLRSRFDAGRVLGLRGKVANSDQAVWLALQGGHWQLATQWESRIAQPNGVCETAPNEFWIGDQRGGAWRWRIDTDGGGLRERRRFGKDEGLLTDADLGTRLLCLDGALYAISGARTQKLDGERFVDAELPTLPSIERPWELESADTGLGTFVWTSRQLWRRLPRQSAFLPLHVSNSPLPGYRSVKLEDDGKLRLAAGNSLLQFDPDIADPEPLPLQASLDRIEQRPPNEPSSLLPLAPPSQPTTLPPASGLSLRFGLATMEPNVEFRYRMAGYNETWSDWRSERVLSYRRLPPGDYVFELQARIRDGREAAPLRYPLRVEPFWHERGWVRALLAIAAALAIAGIAQWIALRRNRRISSQNRELAQKVAERTAQLEQRGRELEAANRKLEELATEDALTGIANRRAMEAALQREWRRAAERGEPLAVVMADVDHFKKFNDSYGHPVGDEQLRRIAQALCEEVSAAGELVARYGGEEFVLILPGASREAALARADRLRLRIARLTQAAGTCSTASFGVAAVVPTPQRAPAELLRRADAALYRAKQNGRNRVEAADEETA